jgi:hypothetical protein
MASLANADDKEELALALRLSQLSSDDFDEQIAQHPSEGSASANQPSCPNTPTSDEKGELAMALRLSELSSDDFDTQVARLHHIESAPANEEPRSCTPRDESEEVDLELALDLSQLLADIFDERASGHNRTGESRAAVDDLASLLTTLSLLEVRTTTSLYLRF